MNEGWWAGKAQTGRYDSTRPPTLPIGRHRHQEEDVASVPSEPIPGRSLVTRRAVIDIVRAANLGSDGVTGFSGGGLHRSHEGLRGSPSRTRARRAGPPAPPPPRHPTVLRDAGLLVSHRHGPSVLHTLTPPGAALLRAGGQHHRTVPA